MQLNPKLNRHLNPFAFPSETNFRFTFLVYVAFIFALVLGQSYIDRFKLNRLLNVSDDSQLSVFSLDFIRFNLVLKTGVGITSNQSSYLDEQISSLISWRNVATQWMLLALVLPLISFSLAWIIYIIYPYRIRHARKLHKLLIEKDPDFYTEMTKLSKITGISTLPEIEIETSSKTIDGQVFGYHDPYIIRLGGRMRLLLRKKLDEFRTIMLHEFAHIANRDIERTYFTQAIWVVLVFYVFTPLLVIDTWHAITFENGVDYYKSITNLARLGGIVAIVWFTANSLIRTREFYADWRVRFWGMGKHLEDLLKQKISQTNRKRITFGLRHPLLQRRLELLNNPRLLFEMNWDIPVICGVLVGISLNMFLSYSGFLGGIITSTIQLWYQSQLRNALITDYGTLSNFSGIVLWLNNLIGNFTDNVCHGLSILPLTLIVAGSLGVQVMRASIVELDAAKSKHGYLALLTPSILVGIGVVIGYVICPFNNYYDSQTYLIMVEITFYCLVVFSIITWFWLALIRFFSRRLLAFYSSKSLPKSRYRAIVFSSALWLCFVYLFLGNTVDVFFNRLYPLGFTQADVLSRFHALPYDAGSTALAVTFLIIVGICLWAALKIFRLLHPPSCPSCSKPIKQKYAIGNSCTYCGQALAPWLYIDSSSTKE